MSAELTGTEGRGVDSRLLAMAAALSILAACRQGPSTDLVTVHHPPAHFDRRAGDLRAHVPGVLAPGATGTFRVNDGDLSPLPQGPPRTTGGQFLIEMDATELRPGDNRLTISATRGAEKQELAFDFTYDDTPPRFPITLEWSTTPIVSADGHWERFRADDGEWRVRSVPGDEGWDRILMLAGASSEPRRVEAEMIYRYRVESGDMGFGVLPLWGGHLDQSDVRPARGWLFSIAWYSGRYRGVGNEFSSRKGKEATSFVTGYYDYPLEAGARYRVIAEAWPERSDGRFVRYRQRMKWWKQGEGEPASWHELADDQRLPLPEREYGVAFVCYRSQVELGSVRILPLDPPPVAPVSPPST